MKFVKGIVIGTMLGSGIAMMYADGMCVNKRKIIKKGRQLAKKVGLI